MHKNTVWELGINNKNQKPHGRSNFAGHRGSDAKYLASCTSCGRFSVIRMIFIVSTALCMYEIVECAISTYGPPMIYNDLYCVWFLTNGIHDLVSSWRCIFVVPWDINDTTSWTISNVVFVAYWCSWELLYLSTCMSNYEKLVVKDSLDGCASSTSIDDWLVILDSYTYLKETYQAVRTATNSVATVYLVDKLWQRWQILSLYSMNLWNP